MLANLLTISDNAKVISTDFTWSIRDHTAAEGPIDVGLALSSLTIAQVIEALDASPSSRSDTIAIVRWF